MAKPGLDKGPESVAVRRVAEIGCNRDDFTGSELVGEFFEPVHSPSRGNDLEVWPFRMEYQLANEFLANTGTGARDQSGSDGCPGFQKRASWIGL